MEKSAGWTDAGQRPGAAGAGPVTTGRHDGDGQEAGQWNVGIVAYDPDAQHLGLVDKRKSALGYVWIAFVEQMSQLSLRVQNKAWRYIHRWVYFVSMEGNQVVTT